MNNPNAECNQCGSNGPVTLHEKKNLLLCTSCFECQLIASIEAENRSRQDKEAAWLPSLAWPTAEMMEAR